MSPIAERPCNVVLLRALDSSGALLFEARVSYDEYYEGSIRLIDDHMFRSERRVRAVEGHIYDSAGNLQSDFRNEYDVSGRYVHGYARHKDGNVTRD